MRRMLCVLALIGRFSGQTYVWRIGPLPRPIPIEWRIPASPRNGILPAWWLAR